MSASDWTPVLVALSAALLVVIPALALFIKSWLDRQTAALQHTVKQSHDDIVETVAKAVNGADVSGHRLRP